jgi:hypothetical protein
MVEGDREKGSPGSRNGEAPHAIRLRSQRMSGHSVHRLVVATLFALASWWLAPRASAQLKMPQESPAATLSLDVGVTTLTVAYHRPALRGRDPWQELGDTKVWRLGANDATTLTFADPVSIGGTVVAAGSYAVFARVGKESWTILLNKVAQQWGSYFYDEKQDLLRLEVKVAHLPTDAKREWFTLSLDPVARDGAELAILWDDVKVVVPIHVDVDAIVAKRIESALKNRAPKDWQTLLAVAQYWCKRKERLDEALDLIDQALALDQNPWTCEWKGRILHEQGDLEPAIPLVEKALELCNGTNFPEGYREGLRVLLKQWRDG